MRSKFDKSSNNVYTFLNMKLGDIIKRLRKERKMTLLGLSKESGVALATLSRIENGRMTGTLQSHMEICKAFKITLPELYKDLPSSKKTLEVQHKKPKEEVYIHDKKSLSEILTSSAQNKKMTPVLIKILKGGQTPSEKDASGTEKFAYILDGKVEAVIGDNRYNLSKDDTLYFESSLPHTFRNIGQSQAELITVTSRRSL